VVVVPTETGPRVGAVVAGDPLRVRWEGTGTEETWTDLPEGALRLSRDSLRLRVLVDRVGVEAQLSDPARAVEVAVSVLRDRGEPLTVGQIGQRLVEDYGLSPSVVKTGSRRLSSALQKRKDVSHETVDLAEIAAATGVTEKGAQARGRGQREIVSSVVRFQWIGTSQALPVEVADASPTEPGVNVPPSPASNETAIGLLLEGDLPRTFDFASADATAFAGPLDELDEKTLSTAIERLVDATRFDLAGLFLATPKTSKAVTNLVRRWPMDESGEAQLAAAANWVLRSADGRQAVRILHSLAVKAPDSRGPLVDVLLAALDTADKDVREAGLDALAATPGPVVSQRLTGRDLAALLRRVRPHPLPKKGRLLAAAWRSDPNAIAQLDLWTTPAPFEELVALADQGADGRILEDPWVQSHIVAPTLTAAVRSIERRAGLAALIGLPNVLFGVVPIDALEASLRRAASSDSALAALLERLGRDADVRALESELADVRIDEKAAQDRARAAEADASLAREAEQRATSRALQAEREQLAAVSRELRQERIDALRSLVDGLAAVGRLDPESNSDKALSVLTTVAQRASVIAIGAVGERTAFDPERHDLLGSSDADEVEVREMGFEYRDSDGATVLRRAAVVRVGP
jgi:hypothetical protein